MHNSPDLKSIKVLHISYAFSVRIYYHHFLAFRSINILGTSIISISVALHAPVSSLIFVHMLYALILSPLQPNLRAIFVV